MIEIVRELGVPFAAVLIIAITAWQEHRRRGDAQQGATLELQESIVQGAREDLQRSTAELRAARQEVAAARAEADAERKARLAAEDELYAYRVDARVWVAQLVAQLAAAKITPAEPPPGFEL